MYEPYEIVLEDAELPETSFKDISFNGIPETQYELFRRLNPHLEPVFDMEL